VDRGQGKEEEKEKGGRASGIFGLSTALARRITPESGQEGKKKKRKPTSALQGHLPDLGLLDPDHRRRGKKKLRAEPGSADRPQSKGKKKKKNRLTATSSSARSGCWTARRKRGKRKKTW